MSLTFANVIPAPKPSVHWDIDKWDTEMGGLKSEIVGNKAFFSLSYSEDNRSLLATGADRSIRLYDPRATEGNLVTAPSLFFFSN